MERSGFRRLCFCNLFGSILVLGVMLAACHSRPAKPPSLIADGITDNTDFLQKLVNSGVGEVVIPPGRFLLGTVDLPANFSLRGQPGAVIVINPERLRSHESAEPVSKTNLRTVFALRGSNVELRKLAFDFSLVDADGIDAKKRPGTLISAQGLANLTFSELSAERKEPVAPLPLAQRVRGRYGEIPKNKEAFNLIQLRDCQEIVMERCHGAHLMNMLDLYQCSRVVSRYNRAVSSNSITCSRSGEQYLWHIGNWSRDVRHQCRWWGGNANDRRKLNPDHPGWDTAQQVQRGIRADEPGYNSYTVGVFDVFVSGNYAEYGRTLAWGSKGREVVISNNIGRYMNDYVLGSEGGENVVFQGNITVNGRTCGLAAYYWSEKLVMSGNSIQVSKEDADPQWSWFADPAAYQGGFIRLHAAGAPDRSGAGQVIISGNICSNDIPGKASSIRIEAGRDVSIQANKIRNGKVTSKRGSGDLTIQNNQFNTDNGNTDPRVDIAAGVAYATISGNVFRREGEGSARAVLEIGADGAKTERSRLVKGNTSTGSSVALEADIQGEGASLIVSDNVFDGTMSLTAESLKTRVLARENTDSRTLSEIQLGQTAGPILVAPDEGDGGQEEMEEDPQ